MRVVKKNFSFASKRKLPFFFVSAAEGTNVVKVFKDSIAAAVQYKKNPEKDDLYDEILDLIHDDTLGQGRIGTEEEEKSEN
mmetsp:Transcript_31229/g.81918  ORF Transcript_31229/g.81918 Transcript_31229/m.81918 type:complete len:81 (+) Transcript_31229:275-517(+)